MEKENLVSSDESTPELLSFLRDTTRSFPDGKVTFGHLISLLGHRSFGAAILFFSIPMIIPMPPGIPLTAGFVITLLGFQILIGRPHLKLPNWLNEKSIDRKLLIKAYDFTERYIGWMFRIAKPRLHKLTGRTTLRASGGIFILLGVLMILPIPIIGNVLPALSCTILALGLIDRDGFIFLLGLLVTGLSVAAMYLMSIGAVEVLKRIF